MLFSLAAFAEGKPTVFSATMGHMPAVTWTFQIKKIESRDTCVVSTMRDTALEKYAPWPIAFCQKRRELFEPIYKQLSKPKFLMAGHCAQPLTIQQDAKLYTFCLDSAGRALKSDLIKWWQGNRI